MILPGFQAAVGTVLCTALMFGVSVAQEGPWTKLKDLPFTVPLGAACEVLDNNLVVVAGNRNMSGVLPLDGAVLETEWTAVPLPITAGYYPRSAVIGNALQFLTFDQEQDDLPKMLVYSPPGNWSAFDLFTFNTTPGDGDLVNLDVPAFSSGAAATIQIEDNTTMLYCGGVNEFDDNFSDACTVIQLSADDIRITYLSQNFSLPAPLLHTCHGGDGNQILMLAGGLEQEAFNETAGALYSSVFLLNTDQSTEWEVLNATLPIPLQAQAGVLLGDTLLCMGGLDINDLGVTALHIINSTSQLATEGAPLPVDGYNGCAVEHQGFVYWVRGESDDPDTSAAVPTAEVYRASVDALLA